MYDLPIAVDRRDLHRGPFRFRLQPVLLDKTLYGVAGQCSSADSHPQAVEVESCRIVQAGKPVCEEEIRDAVVRLWCLLRCLLYYMQKARDEWCRLPSLTREYSPSPLAIFDDEVLSLWPLSLW